MCLQLNSLFAKENHYLYSRYYIIFTGDNMIFKNVRALREDKDLKQREIANYLGVSQNTCSQYETEVIAFTDQILLKLADFYGVSVDYLMDRTNNPQPYK